ncbi:type VI secretion system Vgr family protein [Sinomicrobium weinanense]|uniref:Type VI secretion system tip protein VgrG n=1 Tax=Sinomicrobium weinanense TaxID=2842200 RepID=A0A926JQ56_9FLAO|nr:type VI secretion system tip protein VgrG [Sinomicrobium weinanense]MBC9795273.1 type VI secretion system tip protein VgrG [Sinomicrobium weinanense]MBU3125745.1 type VI secretion system tip protein VgrG [Sinomicrobium weinanense]
MMNAEINQLTKSLLEKVTVQIEGFDRRVEYKNLSLSQGMASHHDFSFFWRFSEAPVEDFRQQAEVIQKYHASRVLVKLKDEKGGEIRFIGVITQMHPSDATGYIIQGKSLTVMLDDIPQSQTFIDKSLPDIIHDATRDIPQELIRSEGISPKYPDNLAYIVQYNETDFTFIRRMARRYGEWFYYDGEQLQFGKLQSYSTELVDKVNLHHFVPGSSILSHKVSLKGYDYENAETLTEQKQTPEQNSRSLFARNALNKSSQNVHNRQNRNYQYVAHVGNNRELQEMQKLLQKASEANTVIYSGVSDAPLQIGGTVTIIKNGIQSEFVIIKATHNSQAVGEYRCHFDAIPADMAVPHYTDPFHTIRTAETQPAVVTDNNDPKGLGRVKVKFHWDYESTWIRMVQPYGGSSKGFYFIPETGEEVLVAFEGGNAEKPYVTGTMYNGNQVSGYATAENDLKVIHTRSGHIIKLNDAKGAENITITDKNKNTIFIDTVGNNIDITANETMTLNAKNMKINVEEDLAIQVGNNKSEIVGNDHMFSANNNDIQVNEEIKVISATYKQQAQEMTTDTSGEIKTNAGGLITIASAEGVDYGE